MNTKKLLGGLLFLAACWGLVVPGLVVPGLADETGGTDVAALVEQLASDDAAVRTAAADALGGLGAGAGEAVPALVDLLEHEDASTRASAARALGGIGPAAAEASPALVRRLADDEAPVRAYAAFALGRIGDSSQPVIEGLIARAVDTDEAVRRSVFAAVRRLDAPAEVVLPLMVQTLEKSDPAAVVPALATLAEAGEAAVPSLCRALAHEDASYWACVVLTDIGPLAKEAVQPLAGVLAHKDPEVRAQALSALAAIGPPSGAVLGEIVQALESDKYGAVQYAAAHALGKIGDKSAIAALKQALNTNDEFLRVVAAWALIQLEDEDEQAVSKWAEVMLEGLRSQDPHVRGAAARAVVESRPLPDSFVAKLGDSLDDVPPDCLAQVVEGIAAQGKGALPRVIRALGVPTLRPYAIQVVRRLGPEAAAAVPALIEALQDKDPSIVKEAEFALGAIGPEASAATDALIQALTNDDEQVRFTACYALGQIGPAARAATPSLAGLLKSEDEFLRFAGIWALLRIHPDDPRVKKAAVPILTQALGDPREHIRSEAAAALGEIGPAAASALEALEPLKDDPSPAVREIVAESIRRIRGA